MNPSSLLNRTLRLLSERAAMVCAALLSGSALLLFIAQSFSQSAVGIRANLDFALDPTTDQAPLRWARARHSFDLSGRATVYLRIRLPEKPIAEKAILVIRGLRAEHASFWLGDGSTARPPEPLARLRSRNAADGLTIELDGHSQQTYVQGMVDPTLTRAHQARWFDAADFERYQQQFDRRGALLFGGALMLVAFCSTVAWLNRDRLFLLFAGWLVTGLSIAAVTAGYDPSWTGLHWSATANALFLKGVLGAHFLVTVALFEALFGSRLGPRVGRLLHWLKLIGVALTALAFMMPYSSYLQLAWLCSVVAMLFIWASSIQIAIEFRHRDAIVYSASWAVMFAGWAIDIALESGFLADRPSVFNSTSGFALTALSMAVALTERIRHERDARKLAERQAISALRKFQNTYDTVPVGLFSMTDDGTFSTFNQAFGEMLIMRRKSDAAMKRWETHFRKEDLRQLLTEIDSAGMADTEITDRDGERWYHVKAQRSKSKIEGSLADITQRRYVEEKLRRLADHDALTDLLNRRGFDNTMEEHARGSPGVRACLACMDLDRFKLVNDMFGHAAGDAVLVEVASRARKVLRQGLAMARLGGDEFAILMPDIGVNDAQQLCEQLLQLSFTEPFQVGDKMFSVSASIGLVELTSEISSKEALSAADRACSEAKLRAGNSVTVYRQSGKELNEHLGELRMIAQMGSKLPVERLRLLCQPIVSLQTPFSNLNYEALLRMVDGGDQLVSPAPLIHAAERHGFMSRLDRWVLDTVLNWLDAHHEHRQLLNYCAVNLSGASLNDERFLNDVMAMIRAHPSSASKICFEVTETVALYDLKNSRRFIDRMRSFGCKVALDDFGAGYTSFNYMKELRVDLIKIDGAYVRAIKAERSNYAITRTIVDLAREMNMSSVAEWAEDAEIVELLLGMGVDYAQGFGLAKPMAMDNMLRVKSSGELVKDPVVLDVLNNKRQPVFRRPLAPAPRGGKLIIPV